MDWQRFLEENNIVFTTRGPNTKKGEVSVQCPHCGRDDPSQHLGINLTTGYWGCLRDSSHRGKSPRSLVRALLGVSSTQAGHIVKQYSHSDPDEFLGLIDRLVSSGKPKLFEKVLNQRTSPTLDDFCEIKPRGVTKRFYQYLIDERGYDDPSLIIHRYGLRCALTGRYKDRIIIPVRHNNELMGWTSRALGSPITAPRYLESSQDIKTTVLDYDNLKQGGERLFIVEGPFDAIRMASFKGPKDWFPLRSAVPIKATCTFGTSVTISQIALLRVLVKKFDQAYVLFDKGADGPANNLVDWIGAKRAYLPWNVKDPGEITPVEMVEYTSPDFFGEPNFTRASLLMSNFAKSTLLRRVQSKRHKP